MEYAKHQQIMSLIFLLTLTSAIHASSLSVQSETKSAQNDLIEDSLPYSVDDEEKENEFDTDELDLLKDEAEKRRMDKMMFHGSLGKRDVGTDSDDLDKRGRMDSYGFTGMLGKRGGRLDRFGFVGTLGKRGGLGRYGYGGMDRYGFIGTLGKRDSEGEVDQPESEKRARLDRYSFFGTLGKRMRYPMGLIGKLGKRSVNLEDSNADPSTTLTRRKRETPVPWYLQRHQRYYPSRWLRGIDRFSFGTRLGKRVPNYRFYPQLGKGDDWSSYELGILLLLYFTILSTTSFSVPFPTFSVGTTQRAQHAE